MGWSAMIGQKLELNVYQAILEFRDPESCAKAVLSEGLKLPQGMEVAGVRYTEDVHMVTHEMHTAAVLWVNMTANPLGHFSVASFGWRVLDAVQAAVEDHAQTHTEDRPSLVELVDARLSRVDLDRMIRDGMDAVVEEVFQ